MPVKESWPERTVAPEIVIGPVRSAVPVTVRLVKVVPASEVEPVTEREFEMVTLSAFRSCTPREAKPPELPMV